MHCTCLCIVQPDTRLMSLQGKAAAMAYMHKHSYTASAAEVQLPQTTAHGSERCKLSGC